MDSNNAYAKQDLKILYITIIFYSLLFIYNLSNQCFKGTLNFQGQKLVPGLTISDLYCVVEVFLFAIMVLGEVMHP